MNFLRTALGVLKLPPGANVVLRYSRFSDICKQDFWKDTDFLCSGMLGSKLTASLRVFAFCCKRSRALVVDGESYELWLTDCFRSLTGSFWGAVLRCDQRFMVDLSLCKSRMTSQSEA